MIISISNLGYRVTEESLNATFATHGTVSSTTLTRDEHTGHSRGRAIVVMHDARERAAAIQRINGSIMDGRIVRAEEVAERHTQPEEHPAANPNGR